MKTSEPLHFTKITLIGIGLEVAFSNKVGTYGGMGKYEKSSYMFYWGVRRLGIDFRVRYVF